MRRATPAHLNSRLVRDGETLVHPSDMTRGVHLRGSKSSRQATRPASPLAGPPYPPSAPRKTWSRDRTSITPRPASRAPEPSGPNSAVTSPRQRQAHEQHQGQRLRGGPGHEPRGPEQPPGPRARPQHAAASTPGTKLPRPPRSAAGRAGAPGPRGAPPAHRGSPTGQQRLHGHAPAGAALRLLQVLQLAALQEAQEQSATSREPPSTPAPPGARPGAPSARPARLQRPRGPPPPDAAAPGAPRGPNRLRRGRGRAAPPGAGPQLGHILVEARRPSSAWWRSPSHCNGARLREGSPRTRGAGGSLHTWTQDRRSARFSRNFPGPGVGQRAWKPTRTPR